MKKAIILTMLFITGLVMAQSIEPKYEIQGNLIKATYFHDNGQIKQEGFYKDGKVHSKWVSFSEAGEKIAIGEYNHGVKIGKWFFWNQNSLNEVDYNNSQIAEVKKWSKDAIVQRD